MDAGAGGSEGRVMIVQPLKVAMSLLDLRSAFTERTQFCLRVASLYDCERFANPLNSVVDLS